MNCSCLSSNGNCCDLFNSYLEVRFMAPLLARCVHRTLGTNRLSRRALVRVKKTSYMHRLQASKVQMPRWVVSTCVLLIFLISTYQSVFIYPCTHSFIPSFIHLCIYNIPPSFPSFHPAIPVGAYHGHMFPNTLIL